MKHALLLFLLSLVGQPPVDGVSRGVAPVNAPAVAEAADAEGGLASPGARPPGGIAMVEEVLGAWRGQWIGRDGAGTPVEVVFAPASRARAVFAYVTLRERDGERTVRRPGRLGDDGLHFDVPGRGEVLLRAAGDARLVGSGLTLDRLRR